MKSEHIFGILVMATVIAIILGGRPILPASTPRIATIETLPDTPKLADVREYTEYGSGILPYNRNETLERARRAWGEPQPIRVGFSYREITFFGLPLWASAEFGLCTFVDTPSGFQIAIMAPEQVKLLGELTGKDWAAYDYPLWQHFWGWLVPLGFLGAVFLYLREAAKRREAEGVY